MKAGRGKRGGRVTRECLERNIGNIQIQDTRDSSNTRLSSLARLTSPVEVHQTRDSSQRHIDWDKQLALGTPHSSPVWRYGDTLTGTGQARGCRLHPSHCGNGGLVTSLYQCSRKTGHRQLQTDNILSLVLLPSPGQSPPTNISSSLRYTALVPLTTSPSYTSSTSHRFAVIGRMTNYMKQSDIETFETKDNLFEVQKTFSFLSDRQKTNLFSFNTTFSFDTPQLVGNCKSDRNSATVWRLGAIRSRAEIRVLGYDTFHL